MCFQIPSITTTYYASMSVTVQDSAVGIVCAVDNAVSAVCSVTLGTLG